jgi:hypothetical protein
MLRGSLIESSKAPYSPAKLLRCTKYQTEHDLPNQYTLEYLSTTEGGSVAYMHAHANELLEAVSSRPHWLPGPVTGSISSNAANSLFIQIVTGFSRSSHARKPLMPGKTAHDNSQSITAPRLRWAA